MATCGKRIEGNVIAYPCSVEMPENGLPHAGPCMAVENPRSVRARKQWEDDQRHAASGLGEFQGPAQTTAQRYTENPTEHPAVTAARIKDAEEAKERMTAAAANPPRYSDPGVPCTACHGAGTIPTEGPFARFGPTIVCPRCQGTKVEGLTEPPSPIAPPMETMPAPTKQRDGDQPLPVTNDLPFIQDAVKDDIEARKQVGIERYGTPLQPFNGRSTMLDVYEEALDHATYGKQLLVEAEEMLQRSLRVAAFLAVIQQVPPEVDADARSLVLWLQQMTRRPEKAPA